MAPTAAVARAARPYVAWPLRWSSRWLSSMAKYELGPEEVSYHNAKRATRVPRLPKQRVDRAARATWGAVLNEMINYREKYPGKTQELIKMFRETVARAMDRSAEEAVEVLLEARVMGLPALPEVWDMVFREFGPRSRKRIHDTGAIRLALSESARDGYKPTKERLRGVLHTLAMARDVPSIDEVLAAHGEEPRDPELWESKVQAHTRRGEFQLALALVHKFESSTAGPTALMYRYAISALGDAQRLHEAERWFELGLARHPDDVQARRLYEALMVASIRCNQPDKAVALRKRMDAARIAPLSTTYNHLMRAYLALEKPKEVIDLYEEMERREVETDPYSVGFAVRAYGNVGNLATAKRTVDRATRRKQADVYVYNALIDAYVRNRRMEEALAELKQMYRGGKHKCRPDTVTYNTIVSGFAFQGDLQNMLEMFQKMKREGVEPNARTYHPIIMYYSEQGKAGDAKLWLERMEAAGLTADTATYNAVLSGHARAAATQDFDLNETYRVIDAMKKRGVAPDGETYVRMMEAHAKKGEVDKVRKLMGEMRERGYQPDSKAYTALLMCLGKEKKMRELTESFVTMKQEGVRPSKVSFTVLAAGYIRCGSSDSAMAALSEMEEENLQVSEVTFSAMVSALNRLKDEEVAAAMKRGKIGLERALKRVARSSEAPTRLETAERLFAEVVRREVPVTPDVVHGLVCFFAEYQKMARAKEVFDTLSKRAPKLESATVDKLMVGFNSVNQPDRTLQVWETAKRKRVPLGNVSVSQLASAYGALDRGDLLEGLREVAKKGHVQLNGANYASIIFAYLRLQDTRRAIQVVLETDQLPEMLSDPSLLTAHMEANCAVGDMTAAKQTWQRFGAAQVTPTPRAINAMLNLIARSMDEKSLAGFVRHVKDSKLEMSEGNRICLVDAYLSCGKVREAMEIVEFLIKTDPRLSSPERLFEVTTKRLEAMNRPDELRHVRKAFGQKYPRVLRGAGGVDEPPVADADADALAPGRGRRLLTAHPEEEDVPDLAPKPSGPGRGRRPRWESSADARAEAMRAPRERESAPPQGQARFGDDRRARGGDDRRPRGRDDRRASFGDDRRARGGDDRRASFGDDRRPHGGDDRRPRGGDDRRASFGDDRRPRGGDDRRPRGRDDRRPRQGHRAPTARERGGDGAAATDRRTSARSSDPHSQHSPPGERRPRRSASPPRRVPISRTRRAARSK